jgi:hypothetical protein
MNNSAEKILYRKAALIFEELGFLMPSDRGGIATGSCHTATVSFKGPFSGCLIVSLDSSILPVLSSNMLGEYDTGNQTMGNDALCEITNIICGNVLPAIYGFKPMFHLDAPRLLNESEKLEAISSYALTAGAQVFFDAGCADISLYAEKGALSEE